MHQDVGIPNLCSVFQKESFARNRRMYVLYATVVFVRFQLNQCTTIRVESRESGN
jgi:hypothetical protein